MNRVADPSTTAAVPDSAAHPPSLARSPTPYPTPYPTHTSATARAPAPRRLAIIGAGWAGLSAAVHAIESGAQCTLFEASRYAGGRARRVEWTARDGRHIALDNGQHIMLGAYHATLDLLQRINVPPEEVLQRSPLCIESTDGFRLRAPSWPAPFHLLAAMLSARGLGWDARLAMLRFMRHCKQRHWRLEQDCSVNTLLDETRQPLVLRRRLWIPLCVAALNTPVESASAQVFLNVLRDSLGGPRSASDLLLPKTDLGAVLPDRALEWIAAHGTVRLGQRVTSIVPDHGGMGHADHERMTGHGVRLRYADGAWEQFDQVVVAVPSHQVATLFDEASAGDPVFAARFTALCAACGSLAQQPIATIYLLYPPDTITLPPMLQLDEDTHLEHHGQWVFNKGLLGGPDGLVAVVISADGPHRDLEQDALAAAIVRQLRTQTGLTATPLDSRVLVEKRATFSCTPDLQRPGPATPHPAIVLAGDYLAGDYPATLESAVRSGASAARALSALPIQCQ